MSESTDAISPEGRTTRTTTTPNRISRARVTTAINEAHRTFLKCFDTLALFKQRQVQAERIVTFQYDLGSALFALDRLYDVIIARKRAVVAKKAAVSPDWFRATLRRLDRYAKALDGAVRIGKQLGDTFAWLFYHGYTHLISEHLKHQGQRHTPSGIGGKGELAFIRYPGIFPDHLLLYHGITSYLRLGDVSLVHLPTMTISGVGELKTQVVNDHEATTTIVLIGERDNLQERTKVLRERVPRTTTPRPPMPQAQKDRLQRQIRRIIGLVGIAPATKRAPSNVFANLHQLEDVIKTAGQRLTHRKVDDGLAIVAARPEGGPTLASRLLPHANPKFARMIRPAKDIAMAIVDTTSNQNSLIMQEITTGFQPGFTPLFWSPLSPDVLKPLFFLEIAVWSWFNPLHLVRKLRARGYEVETGPMGVPERVTAVQREGQPVMYGLSTFMPLLHQTLITEKAFVDQVEQAFQTVAQDRPPDGARVLFHLDQQYGPPLPRTP